MTNAICNCFEQKTIDTTPFCEKKWKTVHFIVQLAKHFFLVAANRIAQFCCCPFKYWRQHFGQKAFYHDVSYGNNLVTYCFYRSHIIDFSINMTKRNVQAPLPGKTPVETLIDIFGQKEVNDAMKGARFISKSVAASGIPIFEDRFIIDEAGGALPEDDEYVFLEKRFKLEPGGNCWGASLDFVFHYLCEIEAGKSPEEAIHAIAHRYVDTPDDAWLTQCLAGAMYFRYEYPHCEASKKLWEECGRDADVFKRHCERKRNEWVAKTLDLQPADCQSTLKTELSSELSERLSHLPPAAYVVTARPEKGGTGHAIALLKTSKTFFLFDSNWGTFSFDKPQATNALWDLSKRFRKEGKCEFVFTAYKLAGSSQIPSKQS